MYLPKPISLTCKHKEKHSVTPQKENKNRKMLRLKEPDVLSGVLEDSPRSLKYFIVLKNMLLAGTANTEFDS
jgi:hypothetical protein